MVEEKQKPPPSLVHIFSVWLNLFELSRYPSPVPLLNVQFCIVQPLRSASFLLQVPFNFRPRSNLPRPLCDLKTVACTIIRAMTLLNSPVLTFFTLTVFEDSRAVPSWLPVAGFPSFQLSFFMWDFSVKPSREKGLTPRCFFPPTQPQPVFFFGLLTRVTLVAISRLYTIYLQGPAPLHSCHSKFFYVPPTLCRGKVHPP